MAAVERPEDLSHTCWRHDLWLASYPLTRTTILDYFALSPFYERTCNNEKAKEQGIEPHRIFTLAPGMEYALQDFQEPHLYVIVKQMRTSFTAATPHAVYYVLDGTIYQAPTLHAVLQSRMKRCLFHIKAAFGKMQLDLDPLTHGRQMLKTPTEQATRHLQARAQHHHHQQQQQQQQQVVAPGRVAGGAVGGGGAAGTQGVVVTREMVGKVDRVLASTLAQFPFPSVVQHVQQLTLTAAQQHVPAEPMVTEPAGATAAAQAGPTPALPPPQQAPPPQEPGVSRRPSKKIKLKISHSAAAS